MANASAPRKRQQSISPDRTALQAFVCLLIVGSLLALSLIIAKFADEAGAPRLGFLTLSIAGAGFLLLILNRLQGHDVRLTRRRLEYALLSGVLFALPNALGFLAIRHVGTGFVAIAFAFPVLVTWVLALLLRMETLRLSRLTGVLLGLSGGLVLAVAKAAGMSEDGYWVALIALIPLVVAAGNIYRTLRWPAGTSAVLLAALMMLGGALALSPFALTLEAMPDTADGRMLGWLLAETAVFAVLYIFYFVLQKLAGPVYLSQIGTVAAVVGTLVAVLLLGEAPPPHLGLVVTLVALGTFFFQRGAATAHGDSRTASD
ncbi:transporter [Marinobacterium nitratireducens]|uniref:Transporter n=1 Tax=Marinobacterium nitratireducens TaxID=518897 RepID=A0A918DVX8_9GAMM|nr:DMT family transporter [Marinobacterium nitratireducens]GGO84603.1 transporter [Marinobacterium nitratireducens]